MTPPDSPILCPEEKKWVAIRLYRRVNVLREVLVGHLHAAASREDQKISFAVRLVLKNHSAVELYAALL